MTYMPDAAGVRSTLVGIAVERATSVLPATTTTDIFSVDGGNVMLTAIVGEFTTVASATATTLTLVHDPDSGGANVTIGAASSSIASSAVGQVVTVAGTTPTVVHGGAAGGVPARHVLGPGDIALTTSATNTGAVKWTVFYVPLTPGATITAV